MFDKKKMLTYNYLNYTSLSRNDNRGMVDSAVPPCCHLGIHYTTITCHHGSNEEILLE